MISEMKTLITTCYTPLHFLFLELLIEETLQYDEIVVFALFANAPIPAFSHSSKLSIKIKHITPQRQSCAARNISNTVNIINTIKLELARMNERQFDFAAFHDMKPETQFLINKTKNMGGQVFLIEDGVAIYPPGGRLSFKWYSKLIGRIMLGMWWHPKEKIGTYTNYDCIYATLPSLIRSDISAKAQRKIDINKLNTINRDHCAHKNIEADTLVLFPLSRETSLADCISILDYAAKFSNKIAIKFHPRELNISFIDALLAHNSKCEFVEGNKTAEEIVIHNKSITAVITQKTSALHILSTIGDRSIRLINIDLGSQETDIVWKQFFSAINIETYTP